MFQNAMYFVFQECRNKLQKRFLFYVTRYFNTVVLRISELHCAADRRNCQPLGD